jgi:hypothetical protein
VPEASGLTHMLHIAHMHASHLQAVGRLALLVPLGLASTWVGRRQDCDRSRGSQVAGES